MYRELSVSLNGVGGRVVRWSWVNFQCRGVLLIWVIVGQGPTAVAVGAGGVVRSCLLSTSLSPSLLEAAQYRLKYCLKGPLNPKQSTTKNFEWCMSVTRQNNAVQFQQRSTDTVKLTLKRCISIDFLHLSVENSLFRFFCCYSRYLGNEPHESIKEERFLNEDTLANEAW